MSKIFQFQDSEFTPDPIWPYKDVGKDTCIVIDNGSHSCRVGWSSDSKPRLTFRNLVAKYRGKKESDSSNSFYFGNDITELEDPKWNIRTQYDMNVVTHFDTQEHAFDYLFSHLGISSQNSVNHPVCITEGVCIPNTFRHHMSEMLFECYNVPKIIYGVDSLFSLNYNMPHVVDGLVVSGGYQTTHVLPIVGGKFDAANSRRVDLGGLNMMIYLRRLLQLKFPNQASVMNLSRAQELMISKSYIARDYFEELKKWQNVLFKAENTISLQMPVLNTTTEKDLEMRRIQARRLKEINQRKREEKLKMEEEKLSKLRDLCELEGPNPGAFKSQLKANGIRSKSELQNIMKELKEKIETHKEKSRQYYEELNSDGKENIQSDNSLTVEEVEELMTKLEDEKIVLIDRRRSRVSRKQALNKRKSYASKERMRILSQLAKEANTNVKVNKEDTFGMKDEDWDVYKFINKDGSESEEEQEQERLNEIEQSLSQYQLLVNKLMVGRGQKYQYLPFDTEQIRVPEILYQPSMVGIDQEGLVGMICYVLKNYDEETRNKMTKNIFITGGVTQFPNFKERLEMELMAVLPFQSKYKVYQARSCLYDSWYGAAELIRNCNNISDISMNKSDYEEQGVGYFKEHKCSNVLVTLDE